MKILLAISTLLLGGCLGLGVQNMTAEQIRATEGMATCTTVYTMYGKGTSSTVNVDNVRKGATQKGKVIIGPECAVSIETDIGVAQPVAPAPKP